MRILFIGDVIGKPGRRVVTHRLDDLRSEHHPDLIILNCENSAAGFGVTPDLAEGFLRQGVDVLTSGNHIWDKKEINDYLPTQPRLLRPGNYADPAPGSGLYIGCTNSAVRYAVMNFQGRIYMTATDCPFRKADQVLASIDPDIKVRFVDFHAEVTSEKMAFGWYLDGRVSGMVGTHTHVPTADERVLPGGMAYLTDCGMTGCYDSVIGMEKEPSIARFLDGRPRRFEPAHGAAKLCGVVIEVDEKTGKAVSIQRVSVQ